MTTREEHVKKIQAGFPSGRTYDPDACALDPDARRLADRYERMVLDPEKRFAFRPPTWVFNEFKRWLEVQYKAMEREINIIPFVPDKYGSSEPYTSSEEMQRDVRDNKRMYVRQRKVGQFAGHLVQKWRTYHDFRGHVLCNAPFTLSGEMRAYVAHCQHHLYRIPACVRPFAWNNVYLENDFRLNRTHFLCLSAQCGSQVIFDEEEFGPQEQFWQSLLPYF